VVVGGSSGGVLVVVVVGFDGFVVVVPPVEVVGRSSDVSAGRSGFGVPGASSSSVVLVVVGVALGSKAPPCDVPLILTVVSSGVGLPAIKPPPAPPLGSRWNCCTFFSATGAVGPASTAIPANAVAVTTALASSAR